MSISIVSPSSTSAIAPPAAASGETWPIDRPEVPPEKRPSVISAHVGAEAAALQVRGRVEHLLHAGAAARTLVADDDDVAGLDACREDRLDRLVLGLDDDGRAAEREDRLVDAGGLDDAAALGEVAAQHRQAAVG